MRELEAYENSPARGGLRIDMPVEQAIKVLAKAKPEPKKVRLPNRYHAARGQTS